MKLTELAALHRAGIDITNLDLGKLSIFSKQTPLDKLSIGAFLDTTRSSNIIDIYSIISNDLGVKCNTQNDKCILTAEWLKQIDMFTKAFESIDRLVIIPQNYANEWNQASSKVQVPPEISLIDTIAQHLHCTWQEATKVSVGEVLLILKLQKREQYFNYLVTNKQKQKQNNL